MKVSSLEASIYFVKVTQRFTRIFNEINKQGEGLSFFNLINDEMPFGHQTQQQIDAVCIAMITKCLDKPQFDRCRFSCILFSFP